MHKQNFRMFSRLALVSLSAVCVSSMALGQAGEIEDNNNKAQALANGAFNLVSGQWVQGNTTGSSTAAGAGSLDMFLIRTGALNAGIYRHRLVLTTTGTEGHIGSIRGLTQTAGVPNAGTDAAFQTSSTTTLPVRFNQWYGFGKQEQLYYQVTGAAATTADYRATLETVAVTPTNIGLFAPGSITITTRNQRHTTDTDMWVYDSNFNAIPGFGNDDTPAGVGGATSALQSTLTRDYAAGTYYLALTNFAFANNLGSPADDNFRTGTVMDFANIAANSNITSQLNMSFAVTDANGTTQFEALKVGPYDVNWYKFTVGVVPEPGSLIALGAGIAALMSRRRRK